jgi:alkyl sulfatase BDS1-like metallo-beta-lactamase superfamily hydrolase
MPKTAFENRAAYENMEWDKINRESNFAKEGILADADLLVIRGENQIIPAWDLRGYSFLFNNYIPYTVNPKLWIQGKLNLNAGLFKVTDNIYQIRGFNLANMTFIKGNTGWIVIDCLSTKETAEAALQFVNKYFGEIPVSAAIITHSHEDHYGGISAVIDHFANGNVEIYVPVNFTNHVIEENVTAGVAMSRRGIYQFGVELPEVSRLVQRKQL